MFGAISGTRRLPPFHADMLAFRVHTSAAGRMRSLTGRGKAGPPAPGLVALTQLEKAGLLDQTVPLGPAARRQAGRSPRAGSVAAAIAAAAVEYHEDDAHTGTVLVDLKHTRHRVALHRALARDPSIRGVWRVTARYLWAAKPAPGGGFLPAPRFWNHAAIELGQVRRLPGFKEPRNIRVAVLDSGVDANHPDLAGRIHEYVHNYHHRHVASMSAHDVVGHGTHISGIIGGRPSSYLSAEGICHAKLTVFKVFTDQLFEVPGEGAMYAVDPILYRWALAECLERRIDVINLSLGGPAPSTGAEASLLAALLARGTTIVAAMGNSLTNQAELSYPAESPGVIAVGATGPGDVLAEFSCHGPNIALCAPGVAIWSTLPRYPGQFGFQRKAPTKPGRKGKREPVTRNTIYDVWAGTSMAAPHVAAAVALLLGRRGRMHSSKVRKLLMRTADKVPGMRGRSFDTHYGAGRLNLRRLLTG